MRPPNFKSIKKKSKSPESRPTNMELPNKATKSEPLTPTKKQSNSVSKKKPGTLAKTTSLITENSLTLLLMKKDKVNLKRFKPKLPERNNLPNHPRKNLPVVFFQSLK